MKYRQRLLLIECDYDLAKQIICYFKGEYRVDHVSRGNLAIERASSTEYVAIIMALHLVDLHGLEICKRLRSQNINTPIIIASSETDQSVRVALFKAGANDFISKPYSFDELMIRIKVRVSKTDSLMTPRIVTEHIILDTVNFSCERDGQTIILRTKEYAILECLVHAAGQIVSRDALIRYVWGNDAVIWLTTVNVHIKNLRDKVDRPFDHQIIKTAHGKGYSLDITKSVVK